MKPQMTKTLDYYLSLSYTIETVYDDGAWVVWIKELEGCITQADAWEEVLPMIEEAKKLWLELAVERGRPIPEPSYHHAKQSSPVTF
jgi:predicted RNase H-like HicB family nuclease